MDYTVPHFIPTYKQYKAIQGGLKVYLLCVIILSIFTIISSIGMLSLINGVTNFTINFEYLVASGIFLGVVLSMALVSYKIRKNHLELVYAKVSFENRFLNGEYCYKQSVPDSREGTITFDTLKDVSFYQDEMGEKYNYGTLFITVQSRSARNSFEFEVTNPQEQYNKLSPLVLNKS